MVGLQGVFMKFGHQGKEVRSTDQQVQVAFFLTPEQETLVLEDTGLCLSRTQKHQAAVD
jgi:hypothetical protein